MLRLRSALLGLICPLGLAAPLTARGADYPVPARIQLIKQDGDAGSIGTLARIVNKPPKGMTFPLPGAAPTLVGGTLRFFQVGVPGSWRTISLPSERWLPIGPSGSKGYRYLGAGSPADPCRRITVTKKVIRAVCKGPTSTDSPSPYGLPVGPGGAAWELRIGADRYCAESSAATGAVIKKNTSSPPRFKAIKAAPPAVCPVAEPNVCDPGGTRACYHGPAGSEGIGTCSAGTEECGADGMGYGPCTGAVEPVPEVCGDGLDNDCDLIADDGCVCVPGSSSACYDGPAGTQGVGACTAGIEVCDASGLGYGPCMGSVEPVAELCDDGLDNSCDGVTDCSDPACAKDPACAPMCGGYEDPCTSDGECCREFTCADPDTGILVCLCRQPVPFGTPCTIETGNSAECCGAVCFREPDGVLRCTGG